MSRTFLSAVFLVVAWFSPLALSTELRCPVVQLDASNDKSVSMRYRAAVKQAPRLYQVIVRKNLPKIKRYLAQGDDPNACALNSSLLANAAREGDMRVVDLLLQAGADLEQPLDAGGETAMMRAIGEERFKAALHLITRGANVKATTQGGISALHLAAATQVDRSITIEREQAYLVRALLIRRLSVNVQTTDGDTALMLAANTGNVQLVKQLLGYGADALLKNADGNSALQIARASQREDISNALQEASAQRAQDALSLAQLIEQNRPAELAQALAKQSSSAQSFRYKQGLLVTAIHARNPQAISLLVEWGIDPDATFETLEGLDLVVYTPLLYSIACGVDRAILQSLLDAGANPNRYVHPSVLETPLLFALSGQGIETAELLIKHGANVNLASPRDGMTPLMSAVILAGHPDQPRAMEFINVLLSAGAQLNAQEEHGLTALHWAAMDSNAQAARLLLTHGAEPNKLDDNKFTPLHYARKNKAKELVALLAPLTRTPPVPTSERTSK